MDSSSFDSSSLRAFIRWFFLVYDFARSMADGETHFFIICVVLKLMRCFDVAVVLLARP